MPHLSPFFIFTLIFFSFFPFCFFLLPLILLLFRMLFTSLPCIFSPPYFECYLVRCFVHYLIASHIALLPHMLLRYLTHCLAWSSPRCLMCLSLPYLTHCFITFSTLPCTLPHCLMCCLFTLMPYLKVPFDPPPSQFVVLLPRDSLPCCFVVYWLVVGTSLLPLLLQGGAWRSEFSSNH